MKITKLEYREQVTKKNVEFRIALTNESCSTGQTMLVNIHTDHGLIGYGEAQPFHAVTGESIETIKAFYDKLAPLLVGKSPYEIESIHQLMDKLAIGQSAAKAGVDIALYDLSSKAAKLPLYRYLGGSKSIILTDMTIGINAPKKMAALAKTYVEEGFTMLKIKVGLNDEDDIEAIRLIREAVGEAIELRLDANQGWGVKQARAVLQAMEAYRISEIEQPVRHDDVLGLKAVRDAVNIDVMADEAIHSPQDAIRLVREEAADLLNIKLMKSGGLFPALAINAIAEAANVRCMVGCMGETPIGIAAGAALVAARKNIAYADLDSHKMIEPIPGMNVAFTQKGSVIRLSEEPGLGVSFA